MNAPLFLSIAFRFLLMGSMEDEVDNSEEAEKSGTIDYFKRVLLLIKFCLTNLTVEPIIFLVYLGWVFGNTIQSPGLYRRWVICIHLKILECLK